MPEFIEYAKIYDLINQDKKYKEECDFVYRWANMPESMLDIGCGTANYWQYFPIRPLGIEKSKEMILQSKYFQDILCEDITTFTPQRDVEFDYATMLFDVINYIYDHSWWERLPIKRGGYLIFDMWDMEKVKNEGFSTTTKKHDNVVRVIIPHKKYADQVDLDIVADNNGELIMETHSMFLYNKMDVIKFSGNNFKIADIVKTKGWQVWYKLIRL